MSVVLDRVRGAGVARGVLADANHLLMASAMVAMWTVPTLLPAHLTALAFGLLAAAWSGAPGDAATSLPDLAAEPGRWRRGRIATALRGAVRAPADHPSHLVLVNAATSLMFLLMAHPVPPVLGAVAPDGHGMDMGAPVGTPAVAAPGVAVAGLALAGALLGLYLLAHAASLAVRRTDRCTGRPVAGGTVAFHVLMGLSMSAMLVGSL